MPLQRLSAIIQCCNLPPLVKVPVRLVFRYISCTLNLAPCFAGADSHSLTMVNLVHGIRLIPVLGLKSLRASDIKPRKVNLLFAFQPPLVHLSTSPEASRMCLMVTLSLFKLLNISKILDIFLMLCEPQSRCKQAVFILNIMSCQT